MPSLESHSSLGPASKFVFGAFDCEEMPMLQAGNEGFPFGTHGLGNSVQRRTYSVPPADTLNDERTSNRIVDVRHEVFSSSDHRDLFPSFFLLHQDTLAGK
jgi:hypothetical protein